MYGQKYGKLSKGTFPIILINGLILDLTNLPQPLRKNSQVICKMHFCSSSKATKATDTASIEMSNTLKLQ